MNIKNKNINKFLSFLLVFCMIFSMIPNLLAYSDEFEQGSDPEASFYTSFDEVYIEKIWDDEGYENKRPNSIDLIIWGTNNYEDSENMENGTEVLRITLTKEHESSDNTWTYTDSIELEYYYYYYMTEELPEGSSYEMVDSWVNSDISEQSIEPLSMTTNMFGAELTNKYIPPKYVQFEIEKIWQDENNKYNLKPTSINVDIYGTNTEGDTSNGEKIDSITLSGDLSAEKWTGTTDIIETHYNYFYVVEENLPFYTATIIQPTIILNNPTQTTNNTSENTTSSYSTEENMSEEAIIQADPNVDNINETFSFVIEKAWLVPTNLLNEIPNSVTFNLYQNNIKIDSLTITSDDALDDTTWINAFNNNYPKFDEEGNPYEYKVIEEASSSLTGTPYISNLNISEDENSISLLNDENNTQIKLEARNGFNAASLIEVIKIWNDEGFESQRPELITIAIYQDSDADGVPDTYLSEIDLTSDDVDPSDPNKWVSFALLPTDIMDPNISPENIYLVEDTTTTAINLLTQINSNYLVNTNKVKITDVSSLHNNVKECLPDDYSIVFNGIYYRLASLFTTNIANNYIEKYKVTITNTITPPNNIQFTISKAWDDENNSYNSRPESIQVEIYGTNTEGDTSGGELLQTVTLNSSNALTINSNIWEITSPVIETEYKYFYVKEICNSANINGTYELSLNTVSLQETTTASNVSVNNTSEESGISPFVVATNRVIINKTWNDNNNEHNERPESVDFTFYKNTENNPETKSLWFKLRLFESTYEILEDPNKLFSDDDLGIYVENWNLEMMSKVLQVPDFIWVEETCENNSYKPILNIEIDDYRGTRCTVNCINTYFDSTFYNVNLTNTFVLSNKNVQFNINKVWEDENNKYNLRPESIQVKIYGSNTEGATSGGELLTTVTLNNTNAVDENTWTITSEEIETCYSYFYAEELVNSDKYTSVISPIEKTEATASAFYNPDNKEEISTFVGGGPEAFTYYVDKYWEDNDNAAGKRPEYVTINLLYKEDYTSNTDYTTYLKFNLYENKIEILEDPLNQFPNGLTASDWSAVIDMNYDHVDYGFYMEEEPVKHYSSEIMEYPMSDYNHIKYGAEFYNTYTPEPIDFYAVNITNTVIEPNNINFNINKTWVDNNNEFNTRPESIQIKIYGTNTENATTSGELLETVILTKDNVNSSNANVWNKSIFVETYYEYFYVVELSSDGTEINSYSLTNNTVTNMENETQLTNEINLTNELKLTTLTVNKLWSDRNNLLNTRPSSINAVIYQNGNPFKEITLTNNGTNVWTLANITVPLCDIDGNNYTYTIEEVNSGNYIPSYSLGDSDDILIITNSIRIYNYSITINKFWDDKGFENERPSSITMNVYATNDEQDAENRINGTLLGEITVSSSNWSATKTFNSTTKYQYVYVTETLPEDSIQYSLEVVAQQLTAEDSTGENYSSQISALNIAPNKKINLVKIWDDLDNKNGLRPSSITIEILQNNNVYNTITLTEANNWEMNDVVVPRFDENGNEYVYTVREATLTGYTPSYAYQESYSGPVKLKFSHFDLFDEGIHTFTIIYELDGEYYSFEIDDGDGSSIPSYGKEFINLDENNCIEIPSSNFYIDYSWGYINGNCDGFAIESIEPIESVETWYGTKIDNINYIDPDNTMIIKDITDLKLEMDNLPDHIDVEFGEAIWKYIGMEDTIYTITNTSDPEIPLTITKIWKDDNNMYNTRPDSLDITVYQNGQVYQVLTFTSANASASNTNVWATTINVPEYDTQGNKYIYTISEDESNLFLDYYYYEPYINQNTLTATNVGIWLPPLEIDIAPSYAITVGKEIINKDNELATENDFWKMHLNINDTYQFPIVLKQLERTISRGDTGMIETYGDYTGVEIHGILNNKNQLVFIDLMPGKYEISENINQYFDFVEMKPILNSDGASLTYENGKYYITLSGVTGEPEEITIKVINKLKDERPFNDLDTKENTFFVSSLEQLTTVASEMARRTGMSGRLTIPSAGVDVALFEVSSSDGTANQKVTDASDSAAYMPWGNQMLIGDHYYQGFDKMKNSKVGTIAYINDGNRIQAYICTEKAAGQNITSDLLDKNGNSLYSRNAGGICMYTCNFIVYDNQDITYSLWQPIN